MSCQAMAKRVVKAERTNHLIVYCVERDRTSIANASFLLAAFLLIFAGKTVSQAAERFTGPCAPYFLAPFRDASFCRQVASPSKRSLRARPFLPAHEHTHASFVDHAAACFDTCRDIHFRFMPIR